MRQPGAREGVPGGLTPPAQTKVKLRFDSVYYPRTVEEYYKVVWNAVDKQMFLDRALD